DEASKKFNNTSDLGSGFSTLSSITSTAIGYTVENQKQTNTELTDRLNKLEAHQKRLELRHTTIGHALNFGERRDRIIPYILQDVAEAYEKARAARAGLRKQLDIRDDDKFTFPKFQDEDNDKEDAQFLDRFVLWTRDTIRKLEIEAAKDIQMDRVI